MYVRGITILPREDSVIEKGLKKLIKGPCPLKDMATAWELKSSRYTLVQKFATKGHLWSRGSGPGVGIGLGRPTQRFSTQPKPRMLNPKPRHFKKIEPKTQTILRSRPKTQPKPSNGL